MMSDSGLKLVHQEKGLYDPNKDSEFKLRIKELPLYNRLRLVVDWISGMTDKYALETYQKLSGIKL
jgi:dGTPase